MSGWVLTMEINETCAKIDRAAMKALRDTVGQSVFDELIEDAIFEVTERIARIEQLNPVSYTHLTLPTIYSV